MPYVRKIGENLSGDCYCCLSVVYVVSSLLLTTLEYLSRKTLQIFTWMIPNVLGRVYKIV